MRIRCFLSTLVLFLLVGNACIAQDFSNKGKDFWVAYGYHERMVSGGNSQDMVLYFAAEQTANVTITIPGVGYSQVLAVPANTIIASATIPKAGAQDARLLTEGLFNKGIHITSDQPVVAYSHIYNASVSGSSILYPTNTLGKEYYSINYTNISNQNNANCWFYVVATDTGTTSVEITPSAATTGGWVANTIYTITLTQGQVYNVMGVLTGGGPPPNGNPYTAVDLTGSKIRSVATASGGCKKIAVYSGSGRIAITCNGAAPSSDNYMSQALPKAAWGKKYLTTPIVSYTTLNGNTSSPSTVTFYRVCVSNPATVVTVNGAPIGLPLQGNFYYQINATTTPLLIEGDIPITVAQYFPSQGNPAPTGCGTAGGDGDPEVIYLSPVEQNINKVIWNASARYQINVNKHYINAVITNAGTAISSFRLDGVAVPAASFTVHPQYPTYSYVRLNVSSVMGNPTLNTGVPHIVQSDSGFNAIAYGYGPAESYGYNAGTNIKDLYQYILIQNQYATVNFPATCRGTPFRFGMVFPYQPTQIHWIFGPALNAMGINDTTLGPPPPTPDSSWVVNGRTLYRYRLPSLYTITAPGTYPIRVIAINPTPDGCGNEQIIDFDVQAFNPPMADFTFTTNGCVTAPVSFFDSTNTGGRPVISRYWNFGDGNTSGVNNPTHTYVGPGAYNVRYSLITDVGCVADTGMHVVNLTDLPVARFGVSNPHCVNTVVNFTDSSYVTGASIVRWTWNFGDGSPVVVINAPASPNVSHTYIATGTYNVTLMVETATGCQSLIDTIPVTIHANPVANFSFPNAICLPVGFVQFTDLSTIAGGSTITGWLWNFGDGSPTSALQNPTHNYAGLGPYTVTLTVTTNDGCPDDTMRVVNNIYAEPLAAFTYPPEVCLGNPANFTDNSTAPGSTVLQWTWNFGDGSPVVIVIAPGNPNVSHTYAAAGTYTVTLNITSAVGCQSVTAASHNVVVRVLPTATISGAITVCLNAPMPNITFTGTAGTAPFTFTYNINGGPNQTVTTVAGNSVTVAVPTNTAGIFTYNLVSVQDGIGGPLQCSQNQTGSVIVTVNALPTATISGNTTVCLNAASPNITFTGATGTAPYTFTYNINGGPNQTVTTVAGNSVTVAVPTNTAGTFIYTLVGVQEGSPQACSQNIPPGTTATVIVNPLPTATISGTTEVCLNDPQPNITFTGAIGTPPYTFRYTINGGPVQIVTTVAGNSVTVAVPTTTAGIYTYALVSVQEGSPTACIQNQSGSAVVTVNPLPTANFNYSAPTCETRVVNFTDLSVPNAGVLNGWTWNFGDGSPNSNLQNPTHTYAAAGTYTVTLQVTTTKGCISAIFSRQVVVSPQPVPNFTVPPTCLSDTYAQFTDASTVASGTITAWLWNFGDPGSGPLNTSTLQNPQHSYSAVGVYTVTLTVTTNNGCFATISQPFTINGNIPVANFIPLNPATMCANDSISIQDASTVNFGGISKIEIYWDNVGAPAVFQTDNSPFPGKIYKHLYPNFQVPLTRPFTIRYRAYSGGTCVDDSIKTIIVNAAPLVQFNNMPPTCLDAAPFQITQASEIGGVPGTGVFSGPGVTPGGIFNPASVGPGTYTILYSFTSTAGGCVDTMSKTITVWQPPLADFSFATPACEKQAVTFSDNSNTPVGTLTTWTWDFADGSPILVRTTGAPFTHTFTNYGTYAVKLIVRTSNGCNSVQKVINVIINPLPKPNFSTPAVSCLPNANVTFTNLSTIADGTPMNYLWNFGDPGSGPVNTSTATNPSHSYVGTGPFNVNLQVTSSSGCVYDTTIILNSIHPQPLALFNVDKTDVCIGSPFRFTDNSNPLDGTISQWNWTMGDGNVRNIPAFNYTYSFVGTYTVSLFIVNSWGCPSTTYTQTVFSNPYPPVNAGPDKVVLEGGFVTLTPAVNAGMPVTYLWTPATGLNNPIIPNTVSSPPDDITYTLTVTTDKGCSASDQVFVKVLKFPIIPNIFSPNGDGVHDRWEIGYLESYPGATVEIYNRYGQLIFHSVGYSNPWDGTINGKQAPLGTYYYIVNPKNGRKIMAGYVDIIR